jgi:hypothetical protein
MPIDLENELETLVDAASLTAVLGALVQVCSARAEQEVTDYAHAWSIAAGRLERCVASIERLGLRRPSVRTALHRCQQRRPGAHVST